MLCMPHSGWYMISKQPKKCAEKSITQHLTVGECTACWTYLVYQRM